MDKGVKNELPPQHTGASSDTVSSWQGETEAAAQAHFDTVRRRFLDVNSWQELAGKGMTAAFVLHDEAGQPVARTPQPGDHIRINIPGPGNDTGEGYDWVRVLQVNDGADEVFMQVKPAPAPVNNSGEVAHFFKEDATSNFVITRKGSEITGEVHGRNEVPNTDNDSILDKVRNAVTAITGILFASKIQWKLLTTGWVQE